MTTPLWSYKPIVQSRYWASTKKPPEGGFLNSNLMIADQAAINAGFDFRL
jgi:hypothetical protein